MIRVSISDGGCRDRKLWTEYVDSHLEATVDHCWEWREILERSFGFEPYYLAAYDGLRVCGILPLFRVPRGFGRTALVSIPFGNYGGVCADSHQAACALVEEAGRLMREFRCSHVALHHQRPVASEDLVGAHDKVRFTKQISGTVDEMFGDLPPSVRKKVRYSTKHGVQIVTSRNSAELYRIHTEKFRRLGTPCFPKEYFDLTLERFGDRAQIHYAVYRDTVIAFNFVLLFRSSFLVTVGGDVKDFLFLHPNYFLYWHELKIAVERGLREVDMCRSSRAGGPADHKRMLGLMESELGYQYLTPERGKISVRSPRDARFSLATRLWRFLPLSCTRLLGPKLVRYFA
jgi:FemAB-related protein (PEP-CTERM system-associated)